MGLALLMFGCWPLLISWAIFEIASRRLMGDNGRKAFYRSGFSSFVILAIITFIYFSTIDVKPSWDNFSSRGDLVMADLDWMIRGLRTWTSLPGIATLTGWIIASRYGFEDGPEKAG